MKNFKININDDELNSINNLSDFIKEKKDQFMELTILEQEKFIKSKWFKDFKDLYLKWYIIKYKYMNEKNIDWFTITAVPYLEKIDKII